MQVFINICTYTLGLCCCTYVYVEGKDSEHVAPKGEKMAMGEPKNLRRSLKLESITDLAKSCSSGRESYYISVFLSVYLSLAYQ